MKRERERGAVSPSPRSHPEIDFACGELRHAPCTSSRRLAAAEERLPAASMASIPRGRSRRRGESSGPSERNASHSSLPAVDRHGDVSSSKQTTYPWILSDTLIAAGNRRGKSREAPAVPMKVLLDEELSKDVNAKHISPGAVGRLMGLDSLPSSGTRNQQRCTQSHAPQISPVSSHDGYGLYEGIPHRRSADDVKDMFDVMEATKIEVGRISRSRNGNISSRPDRIDVADIDIIRQKFINSKRPSTDEFLHTSEEFNETLDALASNHDLLLEFLQKFDPVVRRDLHSHGCPTSTANCITILKPSRRYQFSGTDNIYPQERGPESPLHMQKEVKNYLRKPYSNMSSESLKQESSSLRQKLVRSSHQEKRACPTRIVVLKPNLEKAHGIEATFSLNNEVHSDFGKHKDYQDSGRWSPYTEEGMFQVPLGDSETLGRMGKGSREIAKEITKQMRAARGCSRKHAVEPETRTFVSDDRSRLMSSELCDSWASSSSNCSPTYSTETSVSRQAKKHLCNRWKKAHQFQNQETGDHGFSTLGDMLALSDQDTAKVGAHKMACHNFPKGEVQRDRMQGSLVYPLGISSNDGWRNVATSNYTRSKSLPPSLVRGAKSNNRKRTGSGRHNEFSMLKDVLKVGTQHSEHVCHSRRRQSPYRGSTFHGDESDLMSPYNEEMTVIEREIHVNYEEPANGIAMSVTPEQSLDPANLDDELNTVSCLLDTSSSVPGNSEEPLSPAGQHQQVVKQPATVFDDHLSVPNIDDFSTEDERIEYRLDDIPAVYEPQIESASPIETNHHQGDDNEVLCIPPNGSESPMSSNKDDQKSPVSVLESSVDAEDASLGDFGKISADLQELRMQLQLLKREATDCGDDREPLILSDGETACQPPHEMEECHALAFMDEEERDFTYVHDMLTCLGTQAGNQDELLNVWYLPECTADPDLYSKLEEKYGDLILWPRLERKLLFDVTNTVLADIITSLMQSGTKGVLRRWLPSWDQESFVDTVWQRVVQIRQEMECYHGNLFLDIEWVGSEDGTYLVGSDIGTVLQDDLLEEIIADFIGVTKSAKLLRG